MNNNVIIEGVYRLSGTLTIPDTKQMTYPAVLILSGSGKADRDGNLKRMKMNLYKEIADFLTVNGFITLRYDKRGTYHSGGDFNETGLSDLIDDAEAVLKFLQSHPQVDQDNVFILGHSEGALIAPAVFSRAPVSGLILLAGAHRPSNMLSEWQRKQLFVELKETKGVKGWFFRFLNIPKRLEKQNEKILKKIVETNNTVIRVRGVKLNAKWMRETLAYDAGHYLAEVTSPVLAITGEKDVQVPPEDARKIAETVKGEAEWRILPDLNHILRKYDGEHSMLGLMKEYKALLNQPMDRELLEIIRSWLTKLV